MKILLTPWIWWLLNLAHFKNKPVKLLICPLFFRDRKRSWASRESKFRLPSEAVSWVVSAWLNSGHGFFSQRRQNTERKSENEDKYWLHRDLISYWRLRTTLDSTHLRSCAIADRSWGKLLAKVGHFCRRMPVSMGVFFVHEKTRYVGPSIFQWWFHCSY